LFIRMDFGAGGNAGGVFNKNLKGKQKMNEAMRLSAWLRAYSKYLRVPDHENEMARAGLVMRDLVKQNEILRGILKLERKEPHDAR